jgi:hypothetical protein
MINRHATLHKAIAVSEKQNPQKYQEPKQERAKSQQSPVPLAKLFK